MTFVVTNFDIEFAEIVMKTTLGEDWQNFFDLVSADCRKPLFYTTQNSFSSGINSIDKLQRHMMEGKILQQGNLSLFNSWIRSMNKKAKVLVLTGGGDVQ